jgi:cytidine deaminase
MNKTMLNLLLKAARAAARNSYSPFSGFKVGAAVLADDDRVYSGTNVENSSFGLTVCAERVAIFNAVSAGARTIKAVLVYADATVLTPPCGACLQVVNEFGTNPEIILASDRETCRYRLRDLLPQGFRLK